MDLKRKGITDTSLSFNLVFVIAMRYIYKYICVYISYLTKENAEAIFTLSALLFRRPLYCTVPLLPNDNILVDNETLKYNKLNFLSHPLYLKEIHNGFRIRCPKNCERIARPSFGIKPFGQTKWKTCSVTADKTNVCMTGFGRVGQINMRLLVPTNHSLHQRTNPFQPCSPTDYSKAIKIKPFFQIKHLSFLVITKFLSLIKKKQQYVNKYENIKQ